MANFKDNLNPFSVGFDGILGRLLDDAAANKTVGFPPYNIRKVSDVEFKIDLAVAGLDINDIDIEESNGQLVIRSTFDDKSSVFNGDYLHRGISLKKFTRSFVLADDIEVCGADLKNGLLTVNLKRIVPEQQRPKKITINSTKAPVNNRTLLTERGFG